MPPTLLNERPDSRQRRSRAGRAILATRFVGVAYTNPRVLSIIDIIKKRAALAPAQLPERVQREGTDLRQEDVLASSLANGEAACQ